MRAGSFEPENTDTTTGTDNYEQHRVSLRDRLSGGKKPAAENKSKQEQEIPPNPEQETEFKEPPAADEETATETETSFEEFERTTSEKLEGVDAVELAEIIISVGGTIRGMALPGLYRNAHYPGEEGEDIKDVLKRARENEKQDKEPDAGFNRYEKRLYNKWPEYEKALKNIPLDDKESKLMAKYLAREIGEATVSVWMHKHMFWFYWMGLELKKASPVISTRAGEWWSKKMGQDD